MPPEYMAELRAYIDGPRKLMQQFAGEQWKERGILFPNSEGWFRRRGNVRNRFRTILSSAGLPTHFRLYDLRHTMATLLLQADENVKVVAERMGHNTPVETLRTYAHVLPGMQRRAATKMGAMFYQEVA